MTHPTSPTVSRRWLALEMKRLRKERRLSQATVAKALGCQVPKVSLMETGQRPLQDADLKTLLELFEIPDEDRHHYLDELENAQAQAWWDLYDEATVPHWYANLIGLEQGADRIRAYQPAVVHGLLQTPAYAGEILRGTLSELSEEKCTRLVELRLRRQRRFLQGSGAPSVSVVLDESVLRRLNGDREIMRAQLDHVVRLCHQHENVTVNVVELSRGGASAAALGAFTILNFPLPHDPGVVYRERQSDADFLDTERDIDTHSVMFQGLIDLALSPSESLEMLRDTAQSYATSG
jgi:transcriptional regulator with XRE-family HTH domain